MKTSMLVGPALMLIQKNYLSEVDPMYLVYFAVAMTGLSAAAFLLLYQQITSKQQPGSVTYKSKDSRGRSIDHTLSIRDYDQVELRKLAGKLLLGTLVVGGLYVWKQFTQPLLIQPIMSVMQLIESPLVQIYFFRKAASGSNARPFKEDNPLAAFMGSSEDQAADESPAAQPTTQRIEKKKA